jgi:hypothetical protein
MTPDELLGAFAFVYLIGFACGGGAVAAIRDWRRGA